MSESHRVVRLHESKSVEAEPKKVEHWHRRQAIGLASQLPEDLDDARLVIRSLERLVEEFMAVES